jgi:hypothetical protein
MSESLTKLIVLGATLLFAGCSVDELDAYSDLTGENGCDSNSQCGGQLCDARFRACVARQGELDGLLLEIAPPTSVRGYGGFRFFQERSDLARSSQDLDVIVPVVTQVIGHLATTDPATLASCPFAGLTSLPARVTFTPTEQVLGLNVVAYQGTTQIEDGEHTFQVALPEGEYDVYVEPLFDVGEDIAIPTEGCVLVPQLSRGIAVSGDRVELTFNQATPVPLDVAVAASSGFQDWTVDLIHPVTGQVLSTRKPLERVADADEYQASIHYSLVTGGDYAPTGQELVRLTPPEGTQAPVVLMSRAGLEVFTPGQALIENLEPFGDFVELEIAAVEKGDASIPVRGAVTFAATKLLGVAEGVFTSLEVTAEMDGEGRASARLLPGEYRVRTTPVPDSGYSASETTVTVTSSSSEVQRIEVPHAVELRGRLGIPGGIEALTGTEVFVDPTAWADGCSGDEGTTCAQRFDPVLSRALAEDPFLPRQAVGLVDEHARFSIDDVDCGACEEGDGVLFDVSLRPPQSSRLPWFVRTSVAVTADLDLGVLALGYPVIHQGQLKVTDASCASPETCVLPGALVSAYVLIDDAGEVITDPAALPRCTMITDPADSATTRCARAALKVAEARANDTGHFELLLPGALE